MAKSSPERDQRSSSPERDQRSSSSSGVKYRGVRKRKWGKYVSEIRLPNSRERIWLGSYDTPEKAARAFDAALYCLRGRTANFNFPDDPPDIRNGRSMNPAEIQAAAAQFANSDSGSRPAEHSGPVSESFDWETTEMALTNYGTILDTTSGGGFPDMGAFSEFNYFWEQPMTPSLLQPDNWPEYDEEIFTSEGSSLWNFLKAFYELLM